jgi:HSP20 family molecular chaperone IbpA
MSALMPRLLGDLTGWFDTDFPVRTGHMIRVEDTLTDTEYLVRAELPGLEPGKDIQVTIDEGLLTISAERRELEHTRGRSEFRYGILQRSVRLPAVADTEHITAKYDNGILEVTVPLSGPEPSGRQIPIKS